ncbi:MAG TPA: tetratricopeptide repeat protein [Lacibacter sp.]|nr:tetratricopeptide repeat protein [Lacibacter sp.]HMO89945.1 tetratricopeptide repeat protein [Lacibacter sp.]
MKALSLLVLTALLAGLAAAQTASVLLERGKKKLLRQDYAAALDDFTRVLTQNDTAAEALALRGRAKFHLFDYEGARADYKRSLELSPGRAETWLYSGNLYLHHNEPALALRDYDRALQLDTSLAEARLQRGITRARLNDHSGAVADFSRLPEQETALFYRGVSLYELKQYPASIRDLSRVLELNPGNSDAWYNRGLAHAFNKETEKACTDFRRAQELGSTLAFAALAKWCQ